MIRGLRPEVSDVVEDWTVYLLRRCWQSDPATRLSVEEIRRILEANSEYIRESKAERTEAKKVHSRSNEGPVSEHQRPGVENWRIVIEPQWMACKMA